MTKVLCLGWFDASAETHRSFIEDAKKRGDYLAAVVFHDEMNYEGQGRKPINRQYQRAMSLEKLRLIDDIFIVSRDFNDNLKQIREIKPDVIVFGADQNSELRGTLESYLDSCGVHPKYYVSQEFADGIRIV